MNQEHPITPPPELVQQWREVWEQSGNEVSASLSEYIATQAARWGADAELEACVELLTCRYGEDSSVMNLLRAVRRPKPPSLKALALGALESLNGDCVLEGFECPEKVALIRRALESLPD